MIAKDLATTVTRPHTRRLLSVGGYERRTLETFRTLLELEEAAANFVRDEEWRLLGCYAVWLF
jgi:hypothetical protein